MNNTENRSTSFFIKGNGKQQKKFRNYYASLFTDSECVFAGSLLQRAAKLFPLRTAVLCKDDSLTFEQLYHGSLHITDQLLKAGVRPGDKVCLLFENSITYYQAYYGIWQTGAVIAPLNTFLTAQELEHIINDCKPAAIILSSEFQKKFNHGFFAGITVIVLAEDDYTTLTQKPLAQNSYDIPAVPSDAMAALLYTSGTTGFPKGVMLSSRNILTNVVQIVTSIDVNQDDCLLGILPLFHSFAQNVCVWSSLFLGVRVIVLPRIDRKWILDGFKHKPTMTIAVPALYGLLCMMRNLDLSYIRYFVSGGDALPDKIRSIFEMVYRRKLCGGYGLTEAAPFLAADLDDELKATSTVGRVAFGVECSLRDEHNNEVPAGQIGILWVKGDNIMMGYYNAPEATAAVLQDGWLNTGDFAQFDKQGRLAIVGRYKDLIIHKGFNIYPQEIENVLMGYPGTLKAAVVGFPDEEVGEFPVAFLVIKDAPHDAEKQLKDLCTKHLAAYKVPRHYMIVDDIPMTALNKIDKRALKKKYAQAIKGM